VAVAVAVAVVTWQWQIRTGCGSAVILIGDFGEIGEICGVAVAGWQWQSGWVAVETYCESLY
jgi:hypothetical protein